MELFPKFRVKRPIAVIITCVISYLISLPFTCPGGIYLFELLNEYAANVSLIVVGFFEVFVVAYIYGFNRFMNDIKMMLGKRAGEYYLFLTWYITAPILIVIITFSNLLTAKPLINKAGGGFNEYIYPQWSTILGWFIFITCIIPIPVVFIINYIREYRSIDRKEVTRSIGPESREYLLDDNDYTIKPRYLEAFTRNNLPRDDWGPMKSINHYGLYKRLNEVESVDDIDYDLTRKSVFMRDDSETSDDNIYETKINQESP